jgi:lysophospholipase L1-like esterase
MAKRILFVAIMCSVSLLLLEVGLRAIVAIRVGPKILLYGTGFYRRQVEEATTPITNRLESAFGAYSKYLPNDQKFDYDHATGEKFPVRINSHGFRGADYAVEKKPGTIRVVTLGASSTFGYFSRDNQTYPYQLEQILNRRLTGRVPVEVINLGIPHLTSRQILALLKAEALPLKPDVVTFYEGINDASQMPDEVWREKKEENPQTMSSKVRSGLSAFSVLRSVYHGTRDRLLLVSLIDTEVLNNVIKYSKRDYERHVAGKVEEFVGNVSAMRDAFRKQGTVFIVLKQQARSMITNDVKGLTYEQEIEMVRAKLDKTDAITHTEKAFLTHQLLTDSLETWAHAEHVPFVDIRKLLNQDRDVVVSWVHLSPRGNTMIANALADEIVRDLRLDGSLH